MTAVDPDQARRLLERELERSAYQGAQPTWWDRASKAFLDWLASLRADGLDSPGVGHTLLVVAIVVLVAVAVLVVVARGVPRRRLRVTDDAVRGVFDDDDTRSADELLRSADAAARNGDWSAAVLDGYRATARGLGERDLVPVVPGATARAIAAAAAGPFPTFADELDTAARTFDAVRYLDTPADRSAAEAVVATARTIARTRPAADRSVTTTAVPS